MFYVAKKDGRYVANEGLDNDVNKCRLLTNKANAKRDYPRKSGYVIYKLRVEEAESSACPWVAFRSSRNKCFVKDDPDQLSWTKDIYKASLCANAESIQGMVDQKYLVQRISLFESDPV